MALETLSSRLACLLGLLDFSGDDHRVVLFAAIGRGLLDALTLDQVLWVQSVPASPEYRAG